MKRALHIVAFLFALTGSQAAWAYCTIHADPYGWDKVGRVDPTGQVYEETGSQAVGRVDPGGQVYEGAYGSRAIGRVDRQGLIHADPYGHNPVGHVDQSGRIHDTPYGYHPIGRGEACRTSQAGAGALLLLGL